MIAGKRAELVELLAGLAPVVHDHVPEEAIPPCVIVQPADPFVQLDQDDDTTFSEPGWWLLFDVVVLVELDDEHDNATATAELDALLGTLLARIDVSEGWQLESAGQPGALTTTAWIHHGVRTTVRTRLT